MHPKDAESIQAFATETAAALLRIGEAHNKLHDRVEALEKTLSSQPSPSEADRLRVRVGELEGALRSAPNPNGGNLGVAFVLKMSIASIRAEGAHTLANELQSVLDNMTTILNKK